MSEEDQLARAIALSLTGDPDKKDVRARGSCFGILTRNTNQETKNVSPPVDDAAAASTTATTETPLPPPPPSIGNDYLTKAVLDDFTADLLPGCLTLLEHVPKCVHGVCDLIHVVTKRNGEKWKLNKVVLELVSSVSFHWIFFPFFLSFSFSSKAR